MIKRNPVATLLAGVLLILVLATALLSFTYVRWVGAIRKLQYQGGIINRNRAVAAALARDSVEYSRVHPEIDPILERFGIKPRISPQNGNGQSDGKR